MAQIYTWRRRRLPSAAAPCLHKLADHAEAGEIVGVAFVCLLSDGGFISDTCGSASAKHEDVRRLLKAFDAKIAKRELASRK